MASNRLVKIGTIFSRVEGLIKHGAMKADERPLWFDVYRAFPPFDEPKYSRPKPSNDPIRPIFYPEDQLRAKLHSLGHGMGAVNMMTPTGDTHIKKLIQKYEELKCSNEGLSEEQLIEQAAQLTASERRLPPPPPVKKQQSNINPKSVTSQVFAEANLSKDN